MNEAMYFIIGFGVYGFVMVIFFGVGASLLCESDGVGR